MKTILIISIISLITGFIWFYKQGKNNCEKAIQFKEIEMQTQAIENSRRVFKRKTINRNISIIDDLVFLRENNCKNC